MGLEIASGVWMIMKELNPKISVVMPLFNKKAYICESVRSVLDQNYGNFELLVVDDGSDDGSAAALEGNISDNRMRIIQQENCGEGAARNRGLHESTGELMAFLDADDRWMPTHLSDLVELYNRFPNAGILATRFAYESGNSVLVDTAITLQEPSLFENYFRLATQRAFVINSSSCAIRREVFFKLGGFMERTPIGADQEYWARVGLKYTLAYHPRLSATYRLQVPGSAMANSDWVPSEPPVVQTLKKYAVGEGKNDPRLDDIRSYAAWILLNLAASGVRKGHGRAAKQLLSDPLFQNCRFSTRLTAVRIATSLPKTISVLVFRAHLAPCFRWWRTFYSFVSRPQANKAEPYAAEGLSS